MRDIWSAAAWRRFGHSATTLVISIAETTQALLSDRVRLVRLVHNIDHWIREDCWERSVRDVRGPTEELEWFPRGKSL